MTSAATARLTEQSSFMSDPEVSLHGEDLVIGRLAENDVVIPDASVSKRHARLRLIDNAWQIEDLGSSNGVQVNQTPVSTSRLRDGDVIVLGRCELVFSRNQRSSNS